MGLSWSSAVFKGHNHDFAALAGDLTATAALCKDPRVMVHFTLATVGGTDLVSGEITAFSRRPPRYEAPLDDAVSRAVFKEHHMRFNDPMVEMARLMSEALAAKSVYVGCEDSLGSATYVGFDHGATVAYQVLNWGGSTSYMTNLSPRDDHPTRMSLPKRGIHFLAEGVDVDGPEALFELFYQDDARVRSFVLVDGGRPLPKPSAV